MRLSGRIALLTPYYISQRQRLALGGLTGRQSVSLRIALQSAPPAMHALDPKDSENGLHSQENACSEVHGPGGRICYWMESLVGLPEHTDCCGLGSPVGGRTPGAHVLHQAKLPVSVACSLNTSCLLCRLSSLDLLCSLQ